MDALTAYAHQAWYYVTHIYSGPIGQWGSLSWLLICMALFIPLAFLFPGKPSQPYFRKDMLTDGIYWFMGPHLYGPVFMYFASFLFSLSAMQYVQANWGLSTLPVLLQAVLILLITDSLQYWAHRAFHSASLWKFHAIHHSTTKVDWLSSARFHPVNIILYSTMMNAIVATMGFSYDAFMILIPFNSIYSPLVHANLNWNYGPFKYVLASPVFHRWHHTGVDEGGNKNFAPTFPFLDVMFGTFYMPEGVQPSNFGAHSDPIRENNLLHQMVYPFLSDKPAPAMEAHPAQPRPESLS